MLEVVGGPDRGSWGILERLFFRGRVDPHRFGHRRCFWASVDEALGMAEKGLGQNLASMVEQTRSVTVVNDRRGHQADRAVGVFVGAESVGELGTVLQGLERLGEGIVIGDVRTVVRELDAESCREQSDRLASHGGTAVRVEGAPRGFDTLMAARLLDEAARQGATLPIGEHPADDVGVSLSHARCHRGSRAAWPMVHVPSKDTAGTAIAQITRGH